jgi:hypothetical protein
VVNSIFLAEPGARNGRSIVSPGSCLLSPHSTPNNGAPPDTQAGRLAALLRHALEPFPEARRAVIDALRALEFPGSL